MLIVDVLIEYATSSLSRPFSYALLGQDQIKNGVRVVVNFNNRNVVGYVVSSKKVAYSIKEYQELTGFNIKEIISIIDKEPILNEELVSLANDISQYYFASLISVYQTMLPPSLKPKISSLNKPSIAYDIYVEAISDNSEDLTPKQKEIFYKIQKEGPLLKKDIKTTLLPVLVEKKKIKYLKKEKMRLVQEEVAVNENIELSMEQQKCVDTILTSEDLIFLLEGVTGSGKTEVYMKVAQEILKKGQSVLMLVPEISLTIPMVKRFKQRFKDVAILHSMLTPAEKYDEYRRIASHQVKLVIGARSAIFAPLDNLGLIVIDEEHVESYKQDVSPFYHVLKVAKMRQKYHPHCKIILGSATPSLESKTRALKGIYHQLYLTKRYFDTPLAPTKIIDMLDSSNVDHQSVIFSIELKNAILDRLNKKEQVLLFINRRGYAPYVSCRKCSYVVRCPSCGLAFSYHYEDNLLKCHHCGIVENMVEKCPKCNSFSFNKIGFGTEKVEQELKRLFPQARTLRLDSDVAMVKKSVKKVIDEFSEEKADILIGTQMIAKGHDFKNVSLVGIILADLGLNVPSYRASERTFSLLTQALGRAGRQKNNALAIIQTYMPNHYVIYDASLQDYNRFYMEEMRMRKMQQNPPYTYLTLLTFQAKEEKDVIDGAYYYKNLLSAKFANLKVDVIGPSEPFLAKLNNKYRRKILLKYKKYDDVAPILEEIKENVNKNSSLDVIINVDPSEDY